MNFKITICYYGKLEPLKPTGWAYKVVWMEDVNECQREGFGMSSGATARTEAEELARDIAKASLPPVTYTFRVTPE